VVIARPWCTNAVRSSDTPCRDSHPLVSLGGAISLVVLGSGSLCRGIAAEVLGLHVLRLSLVVRAPAEVVGEDGNIPPDSGMPVGVVISLLSALKSVTVGVVVLTIAGSLVSNSSVGDPETLVAAASSTGQVIGVGLVHTEEEVAVGVQGGGSSRVSSDGVSGRSISD